MAVEYTLNEPEQRLAKFIATVREDNNRVLIESGKVKDRKTGKRDSLDNAISSFGAELVVCRCLNKYPDTSVQFSDAGHYDVKLSRHTVDVKWRSAPDATLIVQARKKRDGKRCDIYMLVTGEFPTYVVRGWMFGRDVFQTKYRATRFENPVGEQPYEIPQSDLNPFFPQYVDMMWGENDDDTADS